MKRPVISINFCGGCNPRIDRLDIAEKVKSTLILLGYDVQYNQQEADVAVYMNGCLVCCAFRYRKNNLPGVVVGAAAVDAVVVAEEELSTEIVRKVRKYVEQLEKCISK
jgi:hypothetical protein